MNQENSCLTIDRFQDTNSMEIEADVTQSLTGVDCKYTSESLTLKRGLISPILRTTRISKKHVSKPSQIVSNIPKQSANLIQNRRPPLRRTSDEASSNVVIEKQKAGSKAAKSWKIAGPTPGPYVANSNQARVQVLCQNES